MTKEDLIFWGAGTARTFRPIWMAEELGFQNIYKNSIDIKNLNMKKRPIAAVADNIELRNVKSLTTVSYTHLTLPTKRIV